MADSLSVAIAACVEGEWRQHRRDIPNLLIYARKRNKLHFLDNLATAVDNGAVYFQYSKTQREPDIAESTEGEEFCAFTNVVFDDSRRNDNPSKARAIVERRLKQSAVALLFFISGRAVRSSWLQNLEYDSLFQIVSFKPRPFGTDFDAVLLTLTWAEWKEPFRQPTKMLNLLVQLRGISMNKTVRRLALNLAAETIGDDRCVAKLAGFISEAVLKFGGLPVEMVDDFTLEVSTELMSGLEHTMVNCFSSVLKKTLSKEPDEIAYTSSMIFARENTLFEYNEYMDAFRLIALPPRCITPSDHCLYFVRGNEVFLKKLKSGRTFVLDLCRVNPPSCPYNNILGTQPYPLHEWLPLELGSFPENLNLFINDGSFATVEIDPENLKTWIVGWKKTASSAIKKRTIEAPVIGLGSYVYGELNEDSLVIFGAVDSLCRSVLAKREIVIDLLTGTAKTVEWSRNVFESLDVTRAEFEKKLNEGNPVVLKTLPNSPLAVCIGAGRVPSTREGFWVNDDPFRTQMEKEDGLDWRKSGYFPYHCTVTTIK